MQRRDFLALCTAPAVAAGGGTRASGAPYGPAPSFPLAPPPDMEAYLARVDAGFERIGRWSPAFGEAPLDDPGKRADLARGSVQAMFLTGMLGDLPLDRQLDRGMQDRILRSMPLFDDVTDGMTDFLASRTREDFDHVQTALRQPGASDRLIAALDAEAELTGVSAPRRAQTRQLLQQVTWRLANQPPALLVGEYLGKVEKVTATDVPSEARQRRLATRVGEKAFWTLQEQPTPAGGGTAPAQGKKGGRRGAKVLGIGLIVFAAGAAMAAATEGDAAVGTGLIAGTVGIVMILVGLVMLLTSSSKPKSKPVEPKPDPPAEPGAPKP